MLLEPINPEDAPGHLYATADEAAGIITRIGRPDGRPLFDCYRVRVVVADVVAAPARVPPPVGHAQCAEVPDRAEPDRGTVDYPAVFRAIDGPGWSGWVGAE